MEKERTANEVLHIISNVTYLRINNVKMHYYWMLSL